MIFQKGALVSVEVLGSKEVFSLQRSNFLCNHFGEQILLQANGTSYAS